MKTKIVSNYIYEGLGFPVTLDAVEMVCLDNEWHPRIDVHQVADDAIKQLAKQEARLTEGQVKFIRSYFSMPLRELCSYEALPNKIQSILDEIVKHERDKVLAKKCGMKVEDIR